MGLFYNMFYKRGEEPNVVTVRFPPGITPTPAGYGSLMSVDYAACVQTKARSMISLPFTLIQTTRNGRRTLDRHPLAKLLNGMANEEMTSSALLAWTVLKRDTFGNAYWFVEWRGGKPHAIWPITSSVLHDYDKNAPEGYRTKYYVAPGDEHVPSGTYFNNEVINIPTAISKDAIKGVSLAQLAAENIGLSVDLERFYRSMLKNGNHQLGHVELPDRTVKPDTLKSLERAIEAKRGIDEAGKAPIFSAGAKWVTDQQTMKDASVIEQQQWVLQQVCRACNVPPWKVYDGSQSTYAGGQQARIDYVTDTIVPEIRPIELALEPVLRSCGLSNVEAKFNVKGLMRGDDASRSQYYREMAYMGAYTRGDIRELEDLEPIPGLDLPLFPLNYGTVNPDGTVNVFNSTNEEKPKAPADGSQTGMED